jgi:hypothetical protein
MFADFQDLSRIPFAEIIRARTANEREQAALETVSRAAMTIGAERVQETIQRAVAETTARRVMRAGDPEPASSTDAGASREMLLLAADIDEQCGSVPVGVLMKFLASLGLGHPHGDSGGNGGPIEGRKYLTGQEVRLVATLGRFAEATGLKSVHTATQAIVAAAVDDAKEQ